MEEEFFNQKREEWNNNLSPLFDVIKNKLKEDYNFIKNDDNIAIPLIDGIHLETPLICASRYQKIDIVNFTKSTTHPFKSLALESAIRL